MTIITMLGRAPLNEAFHTLQSALGYAFMVHRWLPQFQWRQQCRSTKLHVNPPKKSLWLFQTIPPAAARQNICRRRIKHHLWLVCCTLKGCALVVWPAGQMAPPVHTQMPLTASGNAKLIQPHRCHSCSHTCCHKHWNVVPALSSSPPAVMVSAKLFSLNSHLQQEALHSDMTGLKCWLPNAWPDVVQAQLLT